MVKRGNILNLFGIARLLVVAVLAGLGLLLTSPLAQAAADTCTWTGSGSNSYTSAGNWTGCDNGNMPEAGDTLVFPQSASNKTIDVDGSMPVRFINITGSGYVFDRISFDEITVDGASAGITATASTTFNVPLNLGGTTTNVDVWTADNTTMTVTQPVTLDATGDVSIGSSTDGRSGVVAFTGDVEGAAGQLVAINEATLLVTGAGTYQADTVGAESGATFTCSGSSCFGDAANDMYMGGGEVRITDNYTFANDITTSTTTPDSSNLAIWDDASLSGDITVNDSLNIVVTDGTDAILSGDVAIDPDSIIEVIGNGFDDTSVALSGIISGDGGVVAQHTTLLLSGTNTYAGETIASGAFDGAVISARNQAALGSTAGNTTIGGGATLVFHHTSGSWMVGEPIEVAGDGVGGSYNGALINSSFYTNITSTIALTGDTTIANNGGQLLVFNGRFTGTGNLTYTAVNGNGIYNVMSAANDYTGSTTVHNTRLFLAGTDGVNQIPHDLYVDAEDDFAAVMLEESNQISDDANVTLADGASDEATIALAVGVQEDINVVSGDGLIDQGAGSKLGIGAAAGSSEFTGEVRGEDTAMIQKFGTGSWAFSGANIFGGAGYVDYEVAEGTLIVANAVGLENSTVYINGGILRGVGDTGPLVVTVGTLAPGQSPGCLTPQGTVTLGSLATFEIEINGDTACSGYDQVTATSAVDLNNAVLDLKLGYTPTLGTTYTIIQGSSLTNTFNGLPDGSLITVGDVQFRLNYTATAATLTVIRVSAAATNTNSLLASTGRALLPAITGSIIIIVIALGAIIWSRRQLVVTA